MAIPCSVTVDIFVRADSFEALCVQIVHDVIDIHVLDSPIRGLDNGVLQILETTQQWESFVEPSLHLEVCIQVVQHWQNNVTTLVLIFGLPDKQGNDGFSLYFKYSQQMFWKQILAFD